MKSVLSLSTLALCVGMTAVSVQNAQAQAWTNAYSRPTATGDCAGLPAALNTGFTTSTIISAAKFSTVSPYRVIKMAFWLQPGATNTDIYMAEKGVTSSARVLYYNGVDSSLKVIGTLSGISYGGGGVDEQGLLGVALDTKTFAKTNLLYFMWAIGASTASPTNGWRVSSYKINPVTKMIDTASRKDILHIPANNSGRWHTGGAMQFDNFGNLYVALGDNEAMAMGPGNTADLRGGIIRIRPDTTNAKGYTIPANNFGAYWAQKWQDSGLTARATLYRDTAVVKPEIYVKGSRNPYSFSIDKNRLGWVEWSECGPDKSGERGEEHSITSHAAFSGWPFWVGDGVRQSASAGSYDETPEPTGTAWATFSPAGMSTDLPVNNWAQALGADTLPPMHKPLYNSYGVNSSTCAQGGPIVRYDGSVTNPGKMPPHLNHTVMFSDFTGSNIFAVPYDTVTGAAVGSVTRVFTMAKTGRPNINNPVDFQQGPDGALYMADWGGGCCSTAPTAANAGVIRISYTGTCQDPGLTQGVVAVNSHVERGSVDFLRMGPNSVDIIADGAHSVKIMDINGRTVYSVKGSGQTTYALPSLGAGKVFVMRVTTEAGTAVRSFSRL
jgi:glucose/arabinose dehydrogenase